MSNDTIQSLQTLLSHAERERDASRANLRQAEAADARSRAQAEQLEQYRGEYRQRWTNQFSQSGTTSLLACYHGFSQRLDQAIEQQQRQCVGSAQRTAQARLLVQAREQRVAAVCKLMERRLQAQRSQADRLDQKQTDEAAQRAAWVARAAAEHS